MVFNKTDLDSLGLLRKKTDLDFGIVLEAKQSQNLDPTSLSLI